MIRTLALVALTQAFQAPSRRCQLRARRQATDGDELARLREEIKELEDSLEKDKQEQRKAAPVAVEAKPVEKKERITGGASATTWGAAFFLSSARLVSSSFISSRSRASSSPSVAWRRARSWQRRLGA